MKIRGNYNTSISSQRRCFTTSKRHCRHLSQVVGTSVFSVIGVIVIGKQVPSVTRKQQNIEVVFYLLSMAIWETRRETPFYSYEIINLFAKIKNDVVWSIFHVYSPHLERCKNLLSAFFIVHTLGVKTRLLYSIVLTLWLLSRCCWQDAAA